MQWTCGACWNWNGCWNKLLLDEFPSFPRTTTPPLDCGDFEMTHQVMRQHDRRGVGATAVGIQTVSISINIHPDEKRKGPKISIFLSLPSAKLFPQKQILLYSSRFGCVTTNESECAHALHRRHFYLALNSKLRENLIVVPHLQVPSSGYRLFFRPWLCIAVPSRGKP